jgi:hypothetical protein
MKISDTTKILIKDINKFKFKNDYFNIFINFINNNTTKYYNVITFLETFYKYYIYSLKHIQRYFTNKDNKIKIIDNYCNSSNIIDFKYINNYLDNKFIGKNKEKIIQDINIKKIINLNNLHIEIYYNNNIRNIDNLIYNIFLIYNILKNIFKIRERKLNIIIFYCDIKKQHYKKNKIIDFENMNSGISYNNKIILFRQEEILKVFIHELLHTFGVDNHNLSIVKKVKNIFKIDSDNLFNEGYIEFLAIIFHSLFVSSILSNSFNSMKKYFNIIINYEIIFSLVQLIKFLNIYNINFLDFLNNNNYKENTSAFSYIYLKFILIFKYNLFLNYILKYNKISLYNEDNIVIYINYLIKNNYFVFLNNIIHNLKFFIKDYCKNNTIVCKNNKLSLFDFNF